MKKVISLFLSVILIVTMMPVVTISAAEELEKTNMFLLGEKYPYLTNNGKVVSNTIVSGKVYYDEKTNTLTLDNAHIYTKENVGLINCNSNKMNLIIKGDCSIEADNFSILPFGEYHYYEDTDYCSDFDISGGGVLTGKSIFFRSLGISDVTLNVSGIKALYLNVNSSNINADEIHIDHTTNRNNYFNNSIVNVKELLARRSNSSENYFENCIINAENIDFQAKYCYFKNCIINTKCIYSEFSDRDTYSFTNSSIMIDFSDGLYDIYNKVQLSCFYGINNVYFNDSNIIFKGYSGNTEKIYPTKFHLNYTNGYKWRANTINEEPGPEYITNDIVEFEFDNAQKYYEIIPNNDNIANVQIEGKKILSGVYICEQGFAVLDTTTTPYTLTLYNAKINSFENVYKGAGIYADCDLQIKLPDGTSSTINGANITDSDSYGIYCTGDLIVNGTGALTVTGNTSATNGISKIINEKQKYWWRTNTDVTAPETKLNYSVTAPYTYNSSQKYFELVSESTVNVNIPDSSYYRIVSENACTLKYLDSYTFTVNLTSTGTKTDKFAVKANGIPLTANSDGTYTIENITEDQIITVEGVIAKPVIKVPSSNFYFISSSASRKVEYLGSYTFNLKLSDNVIKTDKFAIKANGVPLTANSDGTYTITNITEDQIITVEGIFAKPAITKGNYGATLLNGDSTDVSVFYIYTGDTPYDYTSWHAFEKEGQKYPDINTGRSFKGAYHQTKDADLFIMEDGYYTFHLIYETDGKRHELNYTKYLTKSNDMVPAITTKTLTATSGRLTISPNGKGKYSYSYAYVGNDTNGFTNWADMCERGGDSLVRDNFAYGTKKFDVKRGNYLVYIIIGDARPTFSVARLVTVK